MKPYCRRQRHALNAQINVIPYIDIMLVLLIVFMITTPLLTQSVNLKLPQAAKQKTLQPPINPTVIYINAHGQYYLDQASDHAVLPINFSTLIARVTHNLPVSTKQGGGILIKADRDTHYEAVIQVIAALKQRGIQHISLITQVDKKRSSH